MISEFVGRLCQTPIDVFVAFTEAPYNDLIDAHVLF